MRVLRYWPLLPLFLLVFAVNYAWLSLDILLRFGVLLVPGLILIAMNYMTLSPRYARITALTSSRWVERLQLLLVFLLLQSIILYFIEEGAGRLTGYQRMGFIAAFCVAFLIGAYFINRIVDVLTPRFIHLMVKALVIVPIVSAILLTNGFMLRYFNTLMWPYLWPRPLLYVLMAAFVVIMMFPELFAGIWALRVIGLAMVFVGECYVGHSLIVMLEDRSVLSAMHFIGISGTYLVMVVSYLNQIWPKNNVEAPPLPDELPYVAAVIPTYGEPVDILRQTVHSLKNLDYPRERLHIVISDDGHRDEVRIMAESMDIHYSMGARKDAKAGNLNSALLYLDEHFPQATLILTQDADEIVHPSFLKKTVGYFADEKMAFVQTPKDAMAPHGDPFGVRDRVFYDVIQPGRNGMGAAFSCGSGVLWRIEAVKSIGGYATWNIVEDLTTSYFLHAAGWKSEYHNEILTIGLAPDDIPGLLKQRGTWATDTWRLFLFQNPLAKPGLTMAQRLQYMELGLFYITSSFFMPLVLLTPMMSLFTGDFVPIEGSALFPWIVISVLYYISLAQGVGEFLKRMWQYWGRPLPNLHQGVLHCHPLPHEEAKLQSDSQNSRRWVLWVGSLAAVPLHDCRRSSHYLRPVLHAGSQSRCALDEQCDPAVLHVLGERYRASVVLRRNTAAPTAGPLHPAAVYYTSDCSEHCCRRRQYERRLTPQEHLK
jgi:cellulose synthase/poly-beta-1,6-N-acetylglucosamine synthase-like glycosyltransferase